MAGVRYKFIRISGDNISVGAIFTKGTVEIAANEKGCRDIYHEALANKNNSRGSYASYDSRHDAEEALYAIRNHKQQFGIPFDCESLE